MRYLTTTLALLAAVTFSTQAAPKGNMTKPDFTKGDKIPDGASHDWSLGATGARGWMFSDKLVTTDARQVYITKVEGGSPADGKLTVGDVLLGLDGKSFAYDPRTEIGKALTVAESDAGAGALSLVVWRGGKTANITLKLPILGTYSATAPYDCPKSKRIFEQGCAALAERMAEPNYDRSQPITRGLNGLALLASGNPDYADILEKEAKWAADYDSNGYKSWPYSYVMMFLAEYIMATGDASVAPGLKRLALETANGQSVVGSWGHRFVQEDGRLKGYGMMNAPGVPLTIALGMARAAGVKDPVIDRAIERSMRLLTFYIGKGAIPYGDHAPWIQTHDDNGKNGMAAVMCNLFGNKKGAEYFSRMSLASHGAERDCGHTGNFFNMTWSMQGIAPSGPHATGAWMKEFGAWYFDLARQSDGTFIHQGPPGMRPDRYTNWDTTGAVLLGYAMPLKKIYLTGKRPSLAPQIDAAEAESIISDGRGWTNKDRNSAYDQLGEAQLLERLSNWSPTVRDRAAMAIARKKLEPVDALIKMLESARLETRYGACLALSQLKGKAAQAVPALAKNLKHKDLWLRIQAADALASIGQPAMSTVPELLEMLAKPPSESDPRGMEQRYLSSTVFGKMLRNSLEDVDREILRKAIVAGLQNQDGRSRGAVGGVYRLLTYEEIKPILPAIYQAIVEPAPSGIMFASGVRLSGLELFAQHRIKEGLPLCISVMEIDKWGKGDRIKRCLKALEIYGAAAKPLLPKLKQLEQDLSAHREAKNLKPFIEKVQALIRNLEMANGTVELRSIR